MLAFGLTLLGCSNETVFDLQEDTLSARNGTQLQFNTTLSVKNVVSDEPIVSKAVGQAIVKISKDETKIHYKITTANIDNIFAAHFHMAPAGSNGDVVAPLYGNTPSGPDNGVLAEGYITAGNVVGALAGDLDALIAAIRSGNIYVNVHTADNPGGEIRGQL